MSLSFFVYRGCPLLSFFLGFIRKKFQIFIITSRLIAELNFLVNVHITEKGNSK